MEFPITRQSLQAFDKDKEENELKEKKFAQLLENICTEFKKNMPFNSKKKMFVWQLHRLYQLHVPGTITNVNECIPMLIEKLKQLFIGCDIVVDPLKTYLVIDWS